MKIKYIISIIFLTFASIAIYAQSDLQSAEKMYEAGKYSEAALAYEQILKEKGSSATLLANLGNCYAKAGDYGHAFLCYERSLKLNPSDKEVRNNRAYILSKIEDANKANTGGKNISVTEDNPSFLTRLKSYITHSHTSDTWAVWSASAFLLLCVCIAIYIFTGRVLSRKIGFFGAIGCAIICVVTIIFSVSSAKACNSQDEGVIVGFKVSLMAEPFSSSKPVAIPLVRGTKLDILETEKDSKGIVKWYKVRLNSEIAGWIEASDFEII